ncbi:MAG TPA: cation diffusion facilitator family transporter [Gemmatimonadaceae bacterium]|nr:cation diffusion facilitator family transporter [Gemmatimonadaceae bacterium]HRQ79034.1 cation diffusion facilitator family transporter [Gemmatimonadaceae bacterium]
MSRSAGIQRTLAVVLGLNALVVAVKLVVAVRTGNLTVLGASFESFLDAANNVIAMVVVALAARGPDDDHPYGHDKFETMGALAIVVFLSISCYELLRGAFARWLGGAVPAAPETGEIVLLASTAIVNVAVVAYERRAARRLNSPLLAADAAHTGGDLFVTGLAVISLVTARLGLSWTDPLLAVLVAGVIAYSGWQILRVTVPVLVDERGADAERIAAAACRVRGVTGCRLVRSRTIGSGLVFAEVTVLVAGDARVDEAHAIADQVEDSVRAALGGTADVTVHVEPS